MNRLKKMGINEIVIGIVFMVLSCIVLLFGNNAIVIGATFSAIIGYGKSPWAVLTVSTLLHAKRTDKTMNDDFIKAWYIDKQSILSRFFYTLTSNTLCKNDAIASFLHDKYIYFKTLKLLPSETILMSPNSLVMRISILNCWRFSKTS